MLYLDFNVFIFFTLSFSISTIFLYILFVLDFLLLREEAIEFIQFVFLLKRLKIKCCHGDFWGLTYIIFGINDIIFVFEQF